MASSPDPVRCATRCIAFCVAWLGCAAGVAPLPAEWRADLEALPPRDFEDCGVDLSGVRATDVAIVLDATVSTLDPSGADIDGDGEVGAPASSFEVLRTEGAHDSLLAAQVVAARTLIRAADGRFRIAIAVLGGYQRRHGSRAPEPDPKPRAALVTPLSNDTRELEAGLSSVLGFGPSGTTRFSPGMQVAIEALASGEHGGVALLLSDTEAPLLKRRGTKLVRGDPGAQAAARAAQREGVVFHTLALGAAAGAATPHVLSRIAGATGGSFRAVERADRLHCALAEALAGPVGAVRRPPTPP